MGRVLLVSFLSVVVLLSLFCTIGITVLWRLRRRNRLDPRHPTTAPVIWLLHPGPAARLHRRLRAALATARHRPAGPSRQTVPQSSVDELVVELVREATALDEQLVLAARAPRVVRRQILGTVATDVAAIEQVAGRLAVLVSAAARPGGVPAATALRTIEDRLDAIEVSRQEIADLEAALVVDLTADDRDRSER